MQIEIIWVSINFERWRDLIQNVAESFHRSFSFQLYSKTAAVYGASAFVIIDICYVRVCVYNLVMDLGKIFLVIK